MMASIRSELNLLDAKISEFQQLAEFAADELEPIALEPIEFLDIIDTDVEVQETVVEEETVVDDLPADDDDDLPFFDEPEVVTETVPEPTKEAIQVVVPESVPIIDTMIDRQAWRTDMPGGVVRDVRSAISLNDRILFINKLFASNKA